MAEVTAPPSRPCWIAVERIAAVGEPAGIGDGDADADDARGTDLLAEAGDGGAGAGLAWPE